MHPLADAPIYLVDGLLIRGGFYLLTGRTGAGKTRLSLLLAIRVAQGGGFIGRDCEPGKVLIVAGEDYENVRLQFYAMCKYYNIDPDSGSRKHEMINRRAGRQRPAWPTRE